MNDITSRFCKACRGTGKLEITGPRRGRSIKSCVVCDGWGWQDLAWGRDGSSRDHILTTVDGGAAGFRPICGVDAGCIGEVHFSPIHHCARCRHVLDILASDQCAEDGVPLIGAG